MNSATDVQVRDLLWELLNSDIFCRTNSYVCVYVCADDTSQCVFAGPLEYYPHCDSENSRSNLTRTCLQRYPA